MMGFKFDEEKVTACIDAYIDEHDEKPYIILNSETRKYLPCENNFFNIISSTTTNGDEKTWHSSKIMIDEDLKFGEILIR